MGDEEKTGRIGVARRLDSVGNLAKVRVVLDDQGEALQIIEPARNAAKAIGIEQELHQDDADQRLADLLVILGHGVEPLDEASRRPGDVGIAADRALEQVLRETEQQFYIGPPGEKGRVRLCLAEHRHEARELCPVFVARRYDVLNKNVDPALVAGEPGMEEGGVEQVGVDSLAGHDVNASRTFRIHKPTCGPPSLSMESGGPVRSSDQENQVATTDFSSKPFWVV